MAADVVTLAESLATEARRTNERRLLVLSGDRERGYETLHAVLDALPVPITRTTLVGPDDRLRCEQLPQARAGELLGTTREIVVLDAHAGLWPNALGAAVGAVDGGGLLVLLTPPLATWPQHQGAFADSLAVAPFSRADVSGRFTRRLVKTLRAHRGIAIVDLDGARVLDDGTTDPPPRRPAPPPELPADHRFPVAAYEACRTADQVGAVAAFERLLDADARRAVVLEADRGRGKSSAAGLAAGSFALTGADVLVTAPGFRNARDVFARAAELLDETETARLDREATAATDARPSERDLRTDAGGRIRFLEPAEAGGAIGEADVVIVDEAAALPVSTLESFLAADRIAFATTVHGYEGAGRGFSVRFRDRLEENDHEVTDARLTEPIRYAAGDPIEVWAFRALCLDARPPVDELVGGADPDSVAYRCIEPDDLLEDESLLRAVFGLLVLAHYRTEPNDLARVLDAPNLAVRVLSHDGHVVSVALLAREGALSAATRAAMYEGDRVPGNMIPDVLTSQLRDEGSGALAGIRIVRIATHHAARSNGLGSRLLACVREEFAGETRPTSAGEQSGRAANEPVRRDREGVDWLGAGFGATPDLLRFWLANGYRTVHLSTTRNDASGEYSAIVLAPTSDRGRALVNRHAAWFARRFPAVASDTLSDLDPDVTRVALRSAGPDLDAECDLSECEWRVVAGAAYGPGLFDVDPGPFRRLVVRVLVDDPDDTHLTVREERLLVLRALHGRPWNAVADRLEYHSAGQCMRAFGDALGPLVDRYGDATAAAVRERFADE